jgi:fused signal recognition particle receptor
MSFFKKLFKPKDKKEDLENKENLIEENEILTETIEENISEKKTIEDEVIKLPEEQDIEDMVEEKIERLSVEATEKPKEKKGIFSSLKEKLVKSVSQEGLFGMMKSFFSGRKIIDQDMYDELEDLLIQSDIGMNMTLKIIEKLETEVKKRGIKDASLVYDVLKDVMKSFLVEENTDLKVNRNGLNIILIVGVNGVGKTTTIGKLASKLKAEGKKVIIGAGDTFRAAAIEQLEEWAKRADVEIIKHEQGSDPGAVVFDTLQAAKTRNADVAIIDTAGRLHNKNNLMKELEKINKIIDKQLEEGQDYESLLVIDGTTGQNGLTQAKVFNEVTKLTGFVVTKLDGTAKGGIIFAISEELQKPIKFIGVGEGIEDLREFNTEEYINAIFE